MKADLTAFLEEKWGKNYQNIRFLVAVSGGIDSVVLCELAHQLQLNWAIAHCNFQLRGKESDEDEIFVKQLAVRYQVPIFVQQFETKQYAQELQISIQVAARELRHAWFKKLLQTQQFDYLMTAHQANDVLETALYNLTKGTGIAGLRSMQPIQQHIVRPLWQFERKEIELFAKTQQLTWREDSSNASDKYSRNFIRHQVVPLLEQINPAIITHFLTTAQRLADTEKILIQALKEFEKKAVQTKNENEVWLNVQVLQQTETPLLLLSEYLKKYHFSYAQSQEVWKMLQHSETGKSVFSATHQALKNRAYLIILPISLQKENQNYVIHQLENNLIKTPFFILQKIEPEKLVKSNTTALLSVEKLQFPLTLRVWQNGDSFCPLGMKGRKKKISDFLINAKIPLHQKEKTYVLCNANQEIIWLLGHRIDERFAATEKSKQVIAFEMFDISL